MPSLRRGNMASPIVTGRGVPAAPIAAFIDDDDDTHIARVVATQSQLPIYSRDPFFVHQRPSNMAGAGDGTSLLHSGDNSLPALTGTGTYCSSRSVSSIGNRVLPVRNLENHPQQPLSVPPPPGLTTYECPFNYLPCLLTFSSFIDWYSHSLTHFDGVGPPLTANCCFCDNKFQATTGEECWRYRMEHVDLHHKWGHRLSHARPDFAMFHYLWSKNIVDTATYKGLNGNLLGTETQENAVSPRSGGSVAMRSTSPDNADESSPLYTLNNDPRRQNREKGEVRRQKRSTDVSRLSRPKYDDPRPVLQKHEPQFTLKDNEERRFKGSVADELRSASEAAAHKKSRMSTQVEDCQSEPKNYSKTIDAGGDSGLNQTDSRRLESESCYDAVGRPTDDESTPPWPLGALRSKQFVSWSCPCGKLVIEQLEELERGGIEDVIGAIQQTFDRLLSLKLPTHEYPRLQRGGLARGVGDLLNIFSHAGHGISLTTRSQYSDPQVPNHSTLGLKTSTTRISPTSPSGSVSGSSSDSTHGPPSSDSQPSSSNTLIPYAWIHLCVETYAGRVRLKNVDIRNITTDGPMFNAIKKAYFGDGLLSALRRVFTLRVLVGVRCVYFNIDRYGRVAIEIDDNQIHPPSVDYEYHPCPPKIVGLIPPQFLRYCILDPPLLDRHCRVWRDRMPKYTGAELRCPPDEAFTPGYGLYFMESLSWIKVWIVMALFAIFSFTLSGLWVRYHHGAIQDGFAIGGSILAVATIILGLVHSLDAVWSQRVRQ